MKRRMFLQTTLLSTGALLYAGNLIASLSNNKKMKLSMIYNNVAGDTDLVSKWGLSMWVGCGGRAVLFDTGGEEQVIINNIEKTGLDYEELTAIIISHNHWDHINGLHAILKKTGYDIPVYVPHNDYKSIQKKHPKADIRGVDKPVKIADNIWSTGQLKGEHRSSVLYEQSLMLSSGGNLYVITGCSHPGIVRIVKKAKEINPDDKIKLVAGGFHLLNHSNAEVKNISDELKALGVENIAPSHCTGEEAINIFKKEWGENFITLNLGDTYDI